jgi:Protein of unknown function (DUF2695)
MEAAMPQNTAIPAPSIPAPGTTATLPLTGAEADTQPREGECLRCYLIRMLRAHGCDGTHRWTVRWRDARAPRATGLLRKLARLGGCCCDCEVIFNVWREYEDEDEDQSLPCSGVPDGFVEPCRRPLAAVY